jgi:hypothetical protein
VTSSHIPPGEGAELMVEFVPDLDGPGTHREIIWLETNDPDNPRQTIHFQVIVP